MFGFFFSPNFGSILFFFYTGKNLPSLTHSFEQARIKKQVFTKSLDFFLKNPKKQTLP